MNRNNNVDRLELFPLLHKIRFIVLPFGVGHVP